MPKYRQTIESEDLKNFNTQQSFSSFLTNINGTSNGSSFLDDKKKIMMGGQNYGMAKENSTLSNPNDIHAKSVDHSNQLPFKLNSTRNLYPSYNTNINYNSYMANLENNYYANNPYLAYSFCNENKNNPTYFKQMPMNMKPINDDKAMLDNLMVLIKDQHGCRMLQRKFEEKKADFLFKFYDRVLFYLSRSKLI
jgi:hypothetical protein